MDREDAGYRARFLIRDRDGKFPALRAGPVKGHEDVEVAGGLARLVHDDLERLAPAADRR